MDLFIHILPSHVSLVAAPRRGKRSVCRSHRPCEGSPSRCAPPHVKIERGRVETAAERKKGRLPRSQQTKLVRTEESGKSERKKKKVSELFFREKCEHVVVRIPDFPKPQDVGTTMRSFSNCLSQNRNFIKYWTLKSNNIKINGVLLIDRKT